MVTMHGLAHWAVSFGEHTGIIWSPGFLLPGTVLGQMKATWWHPGEVYGNTLQAANRSSQPGLGRSQRAGKTDTESSKQEQN